MESTERPIMMEVASTQIKAIGYDYETNELYVEFRNGSTYKYLEVPETIYVRLLNAHSVGSVFQSIKNQFHSIKIQ